MASGNYSKSEFSRIVQTFLFAVQPHSRGHIFPNDGPQEDAMHTDLLSIGTTNTASLPGLTSVGDALKRMKSDGFCYVELMTSC